jgi:DNA primase small subunit
MSSVNEEHESKRLKRGSSDDASNIENPLQDTQIKHIDPFRESYYTKSYPYKLLRDFLAQNTAIEERGYYPGNLEFTAVCRTEYNTAVWKRYLAFDQEDEFRFFAQNEYPLRIDLGTYGYAPSCFWRGQNETLKRYEPTYMKKNTTVLVLDVDISKDYEDIRPCTCKTSQGRTCFQCKSFHEDCNCEWKNFSKVCPVCWTYAKTAMLIVDYILRNVWGFTDFYFVFSGSKGFHCWIMDPYTEEFTTEERQALSDSFQPWLDREASILLSEDTITSSALMRGLDDFVMLVFESLVLSDETIFTLLNEAIVDDVTNFFKMSEMETTLFNRYEKMMLPMTQNPTTSWELWQNLKEFADVNYTPREASIIKNKFTYKYTFPRLDIEVTTNILHPKKSPLSIHPDTNRVCIPLLPHYPETLMEFNPSMAPDAYEVVRIDESINKLEEELVINASVLKQLLYCKAAIPCFEPPVIQNDTNKDQETTFCSSAVYAWLTKNVDPMAIMVPHPWIREYHSRECVQCNEHSFLEQKNTLYKWIVSKSWTVDGYSKLLETSLKLAWLSFIRDFCKSVTLEDDVLRIIGKWSKKWIL